MPLYEFSCADCGVFTAQRAIAERDQAAACPDCGEAASRLLSMPNLSLMAAPRRNAFARNEKSCHEPAVATRHRCSSSCGCGPKSTSVPIRPKRGIEVPKLGKFQIPRKKNRPWMLGH